MGNGPLSLVMVMDMYVVRKVVFQTKLTLLKAKLSLLGISGKTNIANKKTILEKLALPENISSVSI